MVFQSPIWLWGLLPWTAVALYLMTRRASVMAVPFLRLWESSATTASLPALRLPALFIWLVLLGMLMAILASAGPVLRGNSAAIGDLTIVLDCGSTMARPTEDGKPFRGVLDRCSQLLGRIEGRVTICPVPGQRVDCDGQRWKAVARQFPVTAIAADLNQTVLDRLRQSAGPVVVLSDQRLKLNDPRVVQISPDPPGPAVAITLLAAAWQPRSQVMVRLENHSPLDTARVRITSGPDSIDREIALKPEPLGQPQSKTQSQDAFFDMPTLGPIVSAEILDADTNDPWHKAYLVRQSSGVRLLSLGDLPESVVRMIAVYSKDRPPGPDSSALLVSDHPLSEQQSGIWIDATESPQQAGATPTVVPSPLTTDVGSWPGIAANAVALPSDFVPVVSIGGSAIIAVREQPSRAVLVRGSFKDWEKSPDFVVFFSNAFAWLAGDKPQYTAEQPRWLGQGWTPTDAAHPPGSWPGIYRSDTGVSLAVNAGSYPSGPFVSGSDEITIAKKLQTSTSGFPLASLASCTALICLLIAACFWPLSQKVQ